MATLYSARAQSLLTSDLYTIDPVTCVAASVGPTGYAITGLAFDPTDGTLYGATSTGSGASPLSLITVNPSTGASTLVGSLGGGVGVTDICFDPSGQLYGWGNNTTPGFYSINKATGTAALISTETSAGGGIDFDGATLYHATSVASFALSLPGLNNSGVTAPFGDAAARTAVGTQLGLAVAIEVSQIRTTITAVGSPSDTPVVSVYDDTAGAPGALLFSQSIPLVDLPNIQIDVPGDLSLPIGSYWFVVSRSGAIDPANFYQLSQQSGTNGANFNGATWGAAGSRKGSYFTLRTGGPFQQVDPITGATSTVALYSGYPWSDTGGLLGAASFSGGVMWLVAGDFASSRIMTLNPATAAVTHVGDSAVTRFDALAWSSSFAPPTAAFSGTPLSGAAPLSVNFTDESTGSPTSWLWDFGDGGTSTSQNPTHIYTVPGTYTVALTATNAIGSDTDTKTAYITVLVPSTNTDCETADRLTPLCSSGTINNSHAPTTSAASDPLNTIYGLGDMARQVWYRLDNPSSERLYARFTLHNPTGAAYAVAAALYLECPTTTDLTPKTWKRFGADASVLIETISGGADAATTLGVLVPASGSVWIEIAGDDLEAAPGWNGDLLLTWEMLTATFYDTLDDGFEGTTSYVADPTTYTAFEPFSVTTYCKLGTKHFAAVKEGFGSGDVKIYEWTEGGSPVSYTMLSDVGGVLSSDADYGPSGIALRTDGTNVWLSAFTTDTVANPYIAGTWTVRRLTVWIYNGAGFTVIGHDNAKTTNNRRGELTACAHSSQPGVLHVIWSEAGYMRNDVGEQSVAQRVTYSKYNAAAQTYQTDLFFTSEIYPGHDFDLVGNPNGAGHMAEADCVISQHVWLTNAYGEPRAFYSKPTSVQQTSLSPSATIAYGTTIDMWDLSTGVAVTLQTINATTVNPFITAMSSALKTTIAGNQVPSVGADTIYFVGSFAVGSGLPDELFVVPNDGATPIALYSSISGTFQSLDDDGDNIWFGTGRRDVGASAITQINLQCPDTVGGYSGVSPYFIRSNGIEFSRDGEAIYTIGSNGGVATGNVAPMEIPILRNYLICTVGDCLANSGIHIWLRTSLS